MNKKLSKDETTRRIEYLKDTLHQNRLDLIQAEISAIYVLLEEVTELLKNPNCFSAERKVESEVSPITKGQKG